MAVIINELEVVVEAPGTPPAAAAAAGPAAAHPPTQPIDLLDIMEREARLGWRVLAH